MSLDLSRYAGMTCQLKTIEDVDVVFGQVQVMEEALEVVGAVAPEESLLSSLPNTRLKMVLYDQEGGFLLLTGQVVEVDANRLRLQDITTYKGVDWSSRRHFRVDVELNSKIFYTRKGETKQIAMPIQIKNISLTGMLVECETALPAEARVEIYAPFLGLGGYNIEAVVVRSRRMKKTMAYGLDFIKLEDWLEQKLCAFIFAKQGEQLRRRVR